jgi:hypothetical protein
MIYIFNFLKTFVYIIIGLKGGVMSEGKIFIEKRGHKRVFFFLSRQL